MILVTEERRQNVLKFGVQIVIRVMEDIKQNI